MIIMYYSSKQSQKLFWELQKQIPENIKEKSYFGEHNGEFVSGRSGSYYKYDFVNSALKKAIEYNGQRFHPQEHQKEDEIEWCVFHPKKTVKEARVYEKNKYEEIENRGYQILTVWDYEIKEFDTLVKKCLDFLLC